MSDDLSSWQADEMPMLVAAREAELAGEDAWDRMIASVPHLDEERSRRVAASLIEGGYIAGAGVFWAFGRTDPIITRDVVRITNKGRSAMGQWPTPDRFIGALESAINDADDEERPKLTRLLEAAKGVSKEVLTDVIAKFISSSAGLP